MANTYNHSTKEIPKEHKALNVDRYTISEKAKELILLCRKQNLNIEIKDEIILLTDR